MDCGLQKEWLSERTNTQGQQRPTPSAIAFSVPSWRSGSLTCFVVAIGVNMGGMKLTCWPSVQLDPLSSTCSNYKYSRKWRITRIHLRSLFRSSWYSLVRSHVVCRGSWLQKIARHALKLRLTEFILSLGEAAVGKSSVVMRFVRHLAPRRARSPDACIC
jgi:hypothetical protein